MTSYEGNLDSPVHTAQQLKNEDNDFSPEQPRTLARQQSIYSITMDELENTVNESGRNFGSMSMDEFLNSIIAEEIQALDHDHDGHRTSTAMAVAPPNGTYFQTNNGNWGGGSSEQLMVQRQGSFSMPSPLSRKTVDEVWDEIQRSEMEHMHNTCNNFRTSPVINLNRRQITYSEMTLEDFLIKAGVVEDPRRPPPPGHHTYAALYSPNSKGSIMILQPRFASRSETQSGGAVGEVPPHSGSMNGNGCYIQQHSSPGVGPVEVAPPLTPVVSSDLSSQGEGENRNEMEMREMMRGGRKRNSDGPIEEAIERRQRRMIKNRESAARSRARKQAYTVELEAEMDKLRKENTHLKHVVDVMKRKELDQQEYEEKPKIRAQNAGGSVRKLARSSSYP